MKAAILRIVMLLAVLSLSRSALAAELEGSPSHQVQCQLDRTVHVTMNYLLYLPKDYQQKESWPLLLFLHGAGERGDDLDLVKKHGPPKLIQEGREYPEAGHDAWTETYANPQLYEWLLQQKRSVKEVDAEKAANTPPEWTSRFNVDKKSLISTGKNPYFILEPGYCLHYNGDNATLTVTVLNDTKLVDGVQTRVVEERETEDGMLIEGSSGSCVLRRSLLPRGSFPTSSISLSIGRT